jgi:hypothetical protein
MVNAILRTASVRRQGRVSGTTPTGGGRRADGQTAAEGMILGGGAV